MEYTIWNNLDDDWKNEFVMYRRNTSRGVDYHPVYRDSLNRTSNYVNNDHRSGNYGNTVQSITNDLQIKDHSILFNDFIYLTKPTGYIYNFVKIKLENGDNTAFRSSTLEDLLWFDNMMNIDYIRCSCILPLLHPPAFRIETQEEIITTNFDPVPPITGGCLECIYINKNIFAKVSHEIKYINQDDSLVDWWENTLISNKRASEVWRRWKLRNKPGAVQDFRWSWQQFNNLMVTERKQAEFDDMMVNLSIPPNVTFPAFFSRCNELWEYRINMPYIDKHYYGRMPESKFMSMLWRNICDEWKIDYVNQRQPRIVMEMITSLIDQPNKANWTWLYSLDSQGQRVFSNDEHCMVYRYIERRVQKLVATDSRGEKRKID